jgi:hypothetical protein
MPIAVVIGLELIDIEHHERDRLAAAIRTIQFLGQPLFDISPVEQAR